MRRSPLAALAIVFTIAHIAFLPSALEDIDSVNFALGVRDFDVAAHRPHPPGYPVYIALGKMAVAMAGPFSGDASDSAVEARALAILSLIGAVASIVLLYRLMTCWSRPPDDGGGAQPRLDLEAARPWDRLDVRALAATALAAACPLFWYLSVRPMSDVPGLAAAVAAQGLLGLAWWRQRPDRSGDRRLAPARIVASGRMIVLGSLVAGVAIGLRSQNAVLTLPLLAGVWFDRIGRGAAGALLGGGVALTIGCLAWAVPLIIASGGTSAYLAALGSQAGEDFAGVEMLYLHPTDVRLAAAALYHTFVAPWDSVPLAVCVLALAATGLLVHVRHDRRTLVALVLVSAPYLVFHLLFQDTTFTRYALPLIPVTAFLAVSGLAGVARRAMVPTTGVMVVWSVAIAAPTLATYARESSPTARVVSAMNDAVKSEAPGALAMHQTYRRPLEAEQVAVATRLPSPPRREWLELARYWREGHVGPVWFLSDERRSDLALIDPQSRLDRADFRWGFSSLSRVGGMRPDAVSWYRMKAPGWFVEEGWALTPETAGMARLMGRGPSLSPITAWIRRRPHAAHLIVGGRNLGLDADPAVRFVVRLDDRELARWEVPPGFFLEDLPLAPGALEGQGPLAALTITSESQAPRALDSAIEQFDVQTAGTLMWAYDDGWHEAEYTPALGVWRWTSARATLRVIDAGRPVRITIRVERPTRYFDGSPVVTMRAGPLVLAQTSFVDSDVWTADVPLDALRAGDGRIIIETDRTFAPAERGGSPDRRRLGLRVFGVQITSQP